MTLLRDKAVQKLQVARPRLNPVKQIAIARKYGCDELVKEPFETLVARKQVLSREEVTQLPLEDLHGLIVRREASQREKAKLTSEALQRENAKLTREALQRENAELTSGQCAHCTRTLQLSIGYCNNCQKCNSCGPTNYRSLRMPPTVTSAAIFAVLPRGWSGEN